MAKRAARKMAETAKNDKPNDNEITVLSDTPTKMVVGERGLAFAVYVLYLLGYITGITAIIGVVIAYIQADSADAPVKSHYIFQIRTFVIGFIYFLVGLLLLNIAVGALIILWALVWSLIRNVKGLLALNRNDPIANPEVVDVWRLGAHPFPKLCKLTAISSTAADCAHRNARSDLPMYWAACTSGFQSASGFAVVNVL